MTDPVIIIVFGEPVGFARTRPNPHGALFTPKKQRVNAAMIRFAAQQEMSGCGLFEGPLALHMLCEFAIPGSWSKKKRALAIGMPAGKKPDIDNCLKQATDALNSVVYRDDAQIAYVSVRKVYGLQPKIVIAVREISPTTTTEKPTQPPTAGATAQRPTSPATNSA